MTTSPEATTYATAGKAVRQLLITIEEAETGVDYYTAELLSSNDVHELIEIALADARSLVAVLETLYVKGIPASPYGPDQCAECGRWAGVHAHDCPADR